MSRAEHLADLYAGRYRWTSDPDKDGDTIRVTNLIAVQGVVISAGKGNATASAALNKTEARNLALAILDLLDGQCPNQGDTL